MEPGTLYVVSTPIGNLEDMTFRGVRVLKEASVIAAEDTRHTRNLLAHFNLDTPLTPYHQHSESARTEALIVRLQQGETVALVTDAGTPGISDPGIDLVSAAVSAGIAVVPVPGASAVLTALVASGIPYPRFVFEGFLPRDKSSMREKLSELAQREQRTMVFYEAGNRTLETLRAMARAFGPDRKAAVGRELTKKFETFTRGTLDEVVHGFSDGTSRGEVTIVVAGTSSPMSTDQAEALSVDDALDAALARGLSERDAVREVTDALKVSRRDVYTAMLSRKNAD